MKEIEIADLYTSYLRKHKVKFHINGFPIFNKEWFITTKPKCIVPFNKRHYISERKQDVAICFFDKDECLYPRLDKVFCEIDIFKQYHSVCMMDVSISPLMLDEVQRMNLLLNLLFTCVLAVNGIKIIPSFRTGNFETLLLLIQSIGYSKYWIMGAVGTQLIRRNAFYEYLFRTKCVLLNPELLLIYGKPNSNSINCLKDYRIEFKTYKDFRDLSYSSEVFYG